MRIVLCLLLALSLTACSGSKHKFNKRYAHTRVERQSEKIKNYCPAGQMQKIGVTCP